MSAILKAVTDHSDILSQYRDGPVGELLACHNLGESCREYDEPVMLIGMCMDHRKRLRTPENFAYFLRTGAANLRRVEFKVSFVIATTGVQTLCLIAHDRCGMTGLSKRRQEFIDGLVANGGWDAAEAAEHFDKYAAMFEIDDPLDFLLHETQRLNARYPKVHVAPLFYKLDDGLLYQVIG